MYSWVDLWVTGGVSTHQSTPSHVGPFLPINSFIRILLKMNMIIGNRSVRLFVFVRHTQCDFLEIAMQERTKVL